jgi:hypothetical protein
MPENISTLLSGEYIIPDARPDGVKCVPMTCRYCFHARKIDLPGEIGRWVAECREAPPLLIGVLSQAGTSIMVQWPKVTAGATSWCSRWKYNNVF